MRPRVILAVLAALTVVPAVAQAAAPELSVSTRLADRREVASGPHSYASGFEDGRFYANGWHITGEMGGIWAPPLKLADGVWFAVNGKWVGPATKFTSGQGYTRFTLPATAGVQVQRTDFTPDGSRAALFGLTLTNPGRSARALKITVDAHSELMTAYPWGFSGVTPNASDNIADHGTYTRKALQFTDDGALPGAPVHHYAALVGSDRPSVSGQAARTGGTYRGDQGDKRCAADDGTSKPSQCDDGPFGRGTGGRLRYNLAVPGGRSRTLWIAVAGSDKGLSDARAQLSKALDDPGGQLAAKQAARAKLAANTVVDLPGDRRLAEALDWGKQNLADLTQSASDLKIRWTNQGKQFPPPLGTIAKATWFGAGFPDYPWIFATDGEYTNFAAMALGQFDTAEAHLRTLRDISDILNDRSGIVVHETVSDGSVWFGHDSQTTAADGTKTNDFNTDETIKFPSAVALIWRWTGDNAFRDEMYDFAKRNLHAVDEKLDVDRDGWPEGSGNVERQGMGPEKLDNAAYYIRALYDLADMAQSKGDAATQTWATDLAKKLQDQFEGTWWDQAVQQYADSLDDPGNTQNFQKHWIGQVPMEAELTSGTQATPGVAAYDHGTTALAGRENECYSGSRPGNQGLYHTGCGGGFDGKGDAEIFSLTTSIQAIGEGNYGRLGPTQQGRYLDALEEPMFGEPATGGTPDEQPGAMPEIFPSNPQPGNTGVPPNIDRCWTCRSMFMQAWGNYGTAWSVVHQHLGVRPFVNRGVLEVVPQVPDGQSSVAGSHIREGDGAATVFASHSGTTYTTKASQTASAVRTLVIGHTLPRGTAPATVTLDGRPVSNYDTRTTNRGVEVSVPAPGTGSHTLVVTAA